MPPLLQINKKVKEGKVASRFLGVLGSFGLLLPVTAAALPFACPIRLSWGSHRFVVVGMYQSRTPPPAPPGVTVCGAIDPDDLPVRVRFRPFFGTIPFDGGTLFMGKVYRWTYEVFVK